MTMSLQDEYAPANVCYGCGPSNPEGLQIKSFVDGDKVICTFEPKPYHHAFPGVLNGGIICSVLDCHCNWASIYYLMQAKQLDQAPSNVTAEFAVKFRSITPMETPLKLTAWLEKIENHRVWIQGELKANEKVTATATGIFVAVPEDHPAFQRWEKHHDKY